MTTSKSCSPCAPTGASSTTNTSAADCACTSPPTGVPLEPSPGVPATSPMPHGLKRPHFFDGMLLTQADLQAQSDYWRAKRQLSNRALGKGVVWGLRTSLEETNGDHEIVIQPGYAMDASGNDLLVLEKLQIPWSVFADQFAKFPDFAVEEGETKTVQVGLRYLQIPEDPKAPAEAHCGPSSDAPWQPTRIRETVQVVLRQIPEATPNGADVLAELATSLGLDPWTGERVAVDQPPFALNVRFGDGEGAPMGARQPTSEPTSEPTEQDSPWAPEIQLSVPIDPNPPAEPIMLYIELVPQAGWVWASGEIALEVWHTPESGPAAWTPVATATAAAPHNLRLGVPVDVIFNDQDEVRYLRINLRDNDEGSPLRMEDTLGRYQTFEITDLRMPLVLEQPEPTESLSNGNGEEAEDAWLARFGATEAELGTDSAFDGLFDNLMPDTGAQWADKSLGLADATATATPSGACNPRWWEFLLERTSDANPPADASLPSDVRAAVLGACYAWMVGALKGIEPDAITAWEAPQIATHQTMVLAWQLLYGEDGTSTVADDQEEQHRVALAKKLGDFFSEWVNSFVYPGPSCDDDLDIAVLGQVTYSVHGPTSMSPWTARDHVVTGPSVAHFLSRFGLNAPQVMASRFVDVLSCARDLVGNAPQPLVAKPSANVTSGDEVGVTGPSTPQDTGVWVLSGDAVLVVGTWAAVQERLALQGVQVPAQPHAIPVAGESVPVHTTRTQFFRALADALFLSTPRAGTRLFRPQQVLVCHGGTATTYYALSTPTPE